MAFNAYCSHVIFCFSFRLAIENAPAWLRALVFGNISFGFAWPKQRVRIVVFTSRTTAPHPSILRFFVLPIVLHHLFLVLFLRLLLLFLILIPHNILKTVISLRCFGGFLGGGVRMSGGCILAGPPSGNVRRSPLLLFLFLLLLLLLLFQATVQWRKTLKQTPQYQTTTNLCPPSGSSMAQIIAGYCQGAVRGCHLPRTKRTFGMLQLSV